MFVTGKYRIFKFVCLSVIYKETTVRPLLYAPLLYADLYYTRFLGQNQVRPTIFDHHSNFDISTLNDTDLILKH